MKRKNAKITIFMLAVIVAMAFSLVIPAEVKAAPKKPGTIATVKVYSYDYDRVKISWSKGKDAKKYRVYQSTSKSGKYKRVATTSKRSLVVKGLVTGKTYYYKVRGVNGSRLGNFSKVKAVTSRLKAPTSLVAKGKSTSSIRVNWNKVNGASGYQIYRAMGANGTYKKLASTSKTYYTNGNLIKNKNYYYKVRAYRKNGSKFVYSAFTKPVVAKTSISSQPSPEMTLSDIRSEMLRRVNIERKKVGAKPLKAMKVIDKTAQEKAVDMYKYNYFSHKSPVLGFFYDQFERENLKPYGGENIAKYQKTVDQVMSDWMKSKGHRENILRGQFTHLGVGYYKGFWVQQFYIE